MKTKKLLVAVMVSAGLAFGITAQATEEKAEQTVDMKSLPTAVQKTIKEKAAGGEIVKVEKENDKGKWNYEVVVKTKGKEWGFEVDKDGKYIGKHDEAKEHKEKGEKY
jgi:uncharacterized membrane protein YkoI